MNQMLDINTDFTAAEQRTDAWFAARLGKVSASRMGDVMARTKTGYGAARGKYMDELLAERLTGQRVERFTSAAMIWGTEKEPLARDIYTTRTGRAVVETGFVLHPEAQFLGASPDGLVGDDGLIEIKCPNTSTHVDTVINGLIDRKYILQMQVQMACTERDWCDFVSFDPRLPEEMQIWTCRVGRDDDLIEEILTEAAEFDFQITEKINALRERFATHHAA